MLILDCIIAAIMVVGIFSHRSIFDSLFLTIITMLVGILSVNALYEMGLIISSIACLIGLVWCGVRTFLYRRIPA